MTKRASPDNADRPNTIRFTLSIQWGDGETLTVQTEPIAVPAPKTPRHLSVALQPAKDEFADRLLGQKEVCARLRIGRSMFFNLCASGDLPSVKLGDRRLVRENRLIEYIDRLEDQGRS